MSFRRILPFLLGLALLPGARAAREPAPDGADVERRVDRLMAGMSLQDELALIGGDGMRTRAVPNVPSIKMSDGPEGVRSWGPSTAYAAGIAMAASWDTGLAGQVGEAIAQDARARGVQILLAPGVNIARAPMNGRNFEYLGEDPFLAARMAVAYIRGVQKGGVAATVKHFAANNSEYDRHGTNADVDERTLREIYLPAFEAAVREAGVAAVMDSYNRVNGLHATQNPHLNLDILKGEWGFRGILMSDWDATYDCVAAANAGLDLEMPRAAAMTPERMQEALRRGEVGRAAVDDKVRRILRTAVRFGFMEGARADTGIELYRGAGRAVALRSALEGMVLLRNEGNLLPLEAGRARTLAIVGPDAWPAVSGGGGSSRVAPYRASSLLTGVADWVAGEGGRGGSGAAGGFERVLYARGLPEPDEVLQGSAFDPVDGQPGLLEEVFATADFSGPAKAHFRIAHADPWKSEMWTPKAAHPQSMRLSGAVTPKRSGRYLFLAGAGGEDRYRLYVDGRLLIEQQQSEGQYPRAAEIELRAGRTVQVRFEYEPHSANLRGGFGYRAVDELISPEAREIAKRADAVIVAAGFDPASESEGYDRTFALPWGQDALIEAMAAENPRTLVTLVSGGGVDMRRWGERVPAILQLWYPGQEGGGALARILFGAEAPSGRLPVTFDRSWDENPTHDFYYPAPRSGGDPRSVRYGEGIFVGYRAYGTSGRSPLYPFGFGLTYTHFRLSGLGVSREGTGFPVRVGVDVANVGARAGDEVVQVYVGERGAPVPRPERELKGFARLRLAPGQKQRVDIDLDPRAFAFYDVASKDWRIDPGVFVISAAESAADPGLSAELRLANAGP